MSPRPYRMIRRNDSAEDTRRRIVEAVYALHAEKGIAATTMRDIAARADVAIGTVYNHFPTYDDAIDACGRYTVELVRPPGVEVLDGLKEPPARLRALVEALYAYYARFPGYEKVRADRAGFPRLEAFMRADEATRRTLLALAIKPRKADARRLALGFAVLDVAVYRAMIESGLGHAEAVELTAAALGGWLLDTPPARTRSQERK